MPVWPSCVIMVEEGTSSSTRSPAGIPSRGAATTPASKPADEHLQELIELIQFTEALSVKIHGLHDETAILRAVAQESFHAGKLTLAIFLLDDDGSHLRAMERPSTPPALAELRERARAERNGQSTEFVANVDHSPLLREVIREGQTIRRTVVQVLRATYPPPVTDLILGATGWGDLACVLAPLQVQDRVIGALGVACPGLEEYLVPPVRNLARHISHALEAAEANALRTRAEAALRESEASLRAVLDVTSEAIFLTDAQFTIIAANQALAARFNMTPDRIAGLNALDIVPAPLAAARREIMARELPAGKPFHVVDRRGDRMLDTTVYPMYDAQGELDKLAFFSHDITELGRLTDALQESESRLRVMADLTPAMFWMKTPDQERFLFVSAAAQRIFGYTSEDFYRNATLWPEIIHPEDRDRVVAFYAEHERQTTETECRIVRRDGQVRWVREVSSPLVSPAGELMMLTGFAEDITDRKYAEAQLRQAEKMASLGLLSGGIAHSLRNPLGAISACAQMQLAYPDDAELRLECARRIESAVQRATQIIENLLRFARPQDVPTANIKVPVLVDEVMVLLADHLAMHHVVLEQEVESGLPSVRGNPPLLQQVLIDLALNACNAMPSGGTLTVSAGRPEPGWVAIRLQDTGHGIPAESLSRVFEPFFTTSANGVGLGLAVSYSIVRQHGGTIQVESQVGQGTTFTIRLPAAAGA